MRISIALWGLLTILVTASLIDKWNHPAFKSVSNIDLINYCKISAFLIIIFFISKLSLKHFFSKKIHNTAGPAVP